MSLSSLASEDPVKDAKAGRVRLVEQSALVLLLVLAAYLFFANLAANPGWYSDEGSDLDIARHLLMGRWQYFAISGTPLVAGRVPLFHLLLAAASAFAGLSITTARLVVALANWCCAALLYLAARRMMGRWVALLAVLAFVVMPSGLLYHRIAFAYNVQALFYVLSWWALWEYSNDRRSRWLAAAALSAACAYMTALTGLPLVAVVTLAALWVRPRSLVWCIPLMLAPGLVFLVSLYVSAPTALGQDMALSLGRTSDMVLAQFFNLVTNYALWLDWTVWVVMGIGGLLLIREPWARILSLAVMFSTLFNVMRAFPGSTDLNFQRYMEVLPFIALGSAQFLERAWCHIRDVVRSDLALVVRRFTPNAHRAIERGLVGATLLLLVVAPLAWTVLWDYYLYSSPESPRPTKLDPVLETEPGNGIAVTDYVNSNTRPGDVVLASPQLAWRISANAADFQQALAFEGWPTENYAAGLPRDRFVFDPSFENAKFVIVDNLWRGWASSVMPPLKTYIARVETWPLAMRQGEFDVYRNPAR
ncbi:MAG: glycosyltransferase family 39 protein [Chloroflexi bacterium]|nr:glycosyltransferase family 39 protein [Chloroflexota bacterium]